MVSGLISGYYENKWIYNKYSLRIVKHPRLIRWLGHKKLDKTAKYLESNIGGLAGNFFLGIFLANEDVNLMPVTCRESFLLCFFIRELYQKNNHKIMKS